MSIKHLLLYIVRGTFSEVLQKLLEMTPSNLKGRATRLQQHNFSATFPSCRAVLGASERKAFQQHHARNSSQSLPIQLLCRVGATRAAPAVKSVQSRQKHNDGNRSSS